MNLRDQLFFESRRQLLRMLRCKDGVAVRCERNGMLRRLHNRRCELFENIGKLQERGI